MTLVPGVFSHSTAATFADARRDLEGTVVRDTSGKMRPGLFFNHAGDLFSRRTDMRLNILDFRAVQDRGGACFFANQGTAVSPAFDAAPAANKRIDVLYVTQEIPALGDAGSVPVFGIVKGVASPTPVAPPLPANRADAIPLFDVEIPAGATSMQSAGVIVTPRYQFTAMAGGKVVVRNLVELAAWQPADSALAYCLADTGEYVRRRGGWIPEDSGWRDGRTAFGITSAAWPSVTSVPFEVSRTGDRVRLRGAMSNSSIFAWGQIAEVPLGWRPNAESYGIVLSGSVPAPKQVRVFPTGVMQVHSLGSNAAAWIFDQVSWTTRDPWPL